MFLFVVITKKVLPIYFNQQNQELMVEKREKNVSHRYCNSRLIKKETILVIIYFRCN
jgi:hypothetical protein